MQVVSLPHQIMSVAQLAKITQILANFSRITQAKGVILYTGHGTIRIE